MSRFEKVRLTPDEFKSLVTHPPGYYPEPVPFAAWKALCNHVTPGRPKSWLIAVYKAKADKAPGVDLSATMRGQQVVWLKPVIVLGKPPVPFWFQRVYAELLSGAAA